MNQTYVLSKVCRIRTVAILTRKEKNRKISDVIFVAEKEKSVLI